MGSINQDPRSQLEAMYRAPAAPDRETFADHASLDIDVVISGWAYAHPQAPAAKDLDGLKNLSLYCQIRGEVLIDSIKLNWGRKHGLNTPQTIDYLATLIQCDLIEINHRCVYWIGG